MDPTDSLSSNPPVSLEQIQTPSPPSPTSFSKVLLVLTGLGLFILGGIGGVLAQKFILSSKTTVNSEPFVNNVSPTPDPTAIWKTYTSPKYNFSLRYPLNWQISEEYTNNPPVLRILPVANLKIEFGNNVSFTIHDNVNNLPLDIFLKKIFPGPGLNPSYLSFAIAGVEGKKTSDIPGVNKNEDIFISYSNHIYQFRLSQGYGENISEQTFDQILSTFKFLDQGSTIQSGQLGRGFGGKGTAVDMNHVGLTDYPDELINFDIRQTLQVKTVVEHRTALNGSSVSVQGYIVLFRQAFSPPPGIRMASSPPTVILADSTSENRDKNYDLKISFPFDSQVTYYVGQVAIIQGTVIGEKSYVQIRSK